MVDFLWQVVMLSVYLKNTLISVLIGWCTVF